MENIVESVSSVVLTKAVKLLPHTGELQVATKYYASHTNEILAKGASLGQRLTAGGIQNPQESLGANAQVILGHATCTKVRRTSCATGNRMGASGTCGDPAHDKPDMHTCT